MKRILVVEDEPEIQEFLSAYLRHEGYGVSTAGDGIEAMDRFRSGQYDLVLLDILLPKIDGFSVCELIRRESAVPIIMLTALDGEPEQIRGVDLQIDDYVIKPFSMPILLRPSCCGRSLLYSVEAEAGWKRMCCLSEHCVGAGRADLPGGQCASGTDPAGV